MSKDLRKHAPVTPEPDAQVCPECGYFDGRNRPAVRFGELVIEGVEVGVIDVGWYCRSCSHTWGFEIVPQEPPR